MLILMRTAFMLVAYFNQDQRFLHDAEVLVRSFGCVPSFCSRWLFETLPSWIRLVLVAVLTFL